MGSVAASETTSGEGRPAGRSGRHAAPRHASRASDPVRLDTGQLPTLADSSPRSGSQAGPLLLLALGITAAVVAWGYLVYLAIDFGTNARDGDAAAWGFLALATVGAIACLFLAMMLVMRLVTRLRGGAPPPRPPRTPGGRRAAR
jgi:hypothetical protein